MSEVAMDALIDLLDDALDEILAGDPTVYAEHEQAAFLRCYEHWLLGGLHDDDIAFLREQLSASDE